MNVVHGGEYGAYTGRRSLCKNIIRQGYYWPTMLNDCTAHAKKYDKCQIFDIVSHLIASKFKGIIGAYHLQNKESI